MRTDLDDRILRGLRELVDAAPVVAPPALSTVERPRRRPVPPRWVAPALAAAAVLTVLAGVTMPGTWWPTAAPITPGDPARPPGPSLPAELAPYSRLTGELSTAPVGPAIMAYGYSAEALWEPNQSLVLAADRPAYRMVDLALRRGVRNFPEGLLPAPVALAPDGAKLAVAGGGRMAVVDLTTGGVTREVAFDSGGPPPPMAWSSGGRWLAWGVDAQEQAIALLDTVTGEQRRFPVTGRVDSLAFHPDGQRLAVRVSTEVPLRILTLDGALERTLDVGPSAGLAGPGAWSPDGRRLAVLAATKSGDFETDSIVLVDAVRGAQVGSVDETFSTARPEGHRGQSFVAWASPDSVLVFRPGTGSIVEVPVTGGAAQVVTRFPMESGRQPTGVQVAYALLPGTAGRSDDTAPDRGPVPAGLVRLGFTTGAGGLLVLAAGAWLFRRRWLPL